MKFRDLNFSSGKIFVAMEYYFLILNRTFLMVIGDDELIGLKIRGVTSTENNSNSLASLATNKLAVTDNLDDPNSYINSKLLGKYAELDVQSPRVMEMDNSNFKVKFDDVLSVYHDKRKKWGMGYYPHDGKVFVETGSVKKELIILGNQKGSEIAKQLNSAIEKYR